VGWILAACGGRTEGVVAPDSGGGRTSQDEAGADSSAENDAGAHCLTIDLSAFDTSCTGDTDCIPVYDGTLCDGYTCVCPIGGAINVNDQSRYAALVDTVHRGSGPGCGCPAVGNPRCLQGQCVYCDRFPSPPPGCGDGG